MSPLLVDAMKMAVSKINSVTLFELCADFVCLYYTCRTQIKLHNGFASQYGGS